MDSLGAGPLDPLGVSAAEYDDLPPEERPDPRRLCPWVPSPLCVAHAVADLAGVTADDTVLDLGCGGGEVLMRLAALTGCRVHGVDISPSYIRTAQQRATDRGLGQERATFQVADFCCPTMRVPARATVVYVYLLPHVLAQLRGLLQAAVVRQGAVVVSNQYHPDCLGRHARALEGPEGRWQLHLFRRPRSS